jgi:anti-sigma B factor antagonist
VAIKIDVRETDGQAFVIELSGDIDMNGSPMVKDAITELIDNNHFNLVINIEKVRYVDATGLGVLIGGLKLARKHGGTVRIVCTNPQIRRSLDITGVIKILAVFDDERAALGFSA